MESSAGVRVRFAPSPTGYLHVGGARTALFNWLFARKHKGAFVLRIEDTDRERSSPAMTDAILESMLWLGLQWDEGPLHQADGLARHQRDAQQLLRSGAAYRCFCTAAEIEQKRTEAGQGYRYDRKCLLQASTEESEARARAGQAHTLRVRVPDGITVWDDAVHGRLEATNAGLDDFIIMRSDSTPIYNLAVVSDDIEMRITHVIRGDDHISNTPKQILLYQALGAALPVFAHVPMILGGDGKRLSKRHGATAVGEYERLGILPAALRNFLALLGWAPGDDLEIMPLEQMIDRFSLQAINKKSAVFDAKKLQWMNGQYINGADAPALVPLVLQQLAHSDPDLAAALPADARLTRTIELLKPRARSVIELAEQARPYVGDSIDYDIEAVQKHWQDATAVAERLSALRTRLAGLPDWQSDQMEATLRELAEQLGEPASHLIHPLRVALTGRAASPGIFDVLAVLGREVSLQRIDSALKKLSAGPN
ncbi:MAG: glutamate--tRNA ligase [Longimicrobiales bacterium]